MGDYTLFTIAYTISSRRAASCDRCFGLLGRRQRRTLEGSLLHALPTAAAAPRRANSAWSNVHLLYSTVLLYAYYDYHNYAYYDSLKRGGLVKAVVAL